MPWRELEYLVHVWSRHLGNQRKRARTLPFILPIVLLQRRAWNTPTRLSEIIDLPAELRGVLGTPMELELLTDDLSASVQGGAKDDPRGVAFVNVARALLHAHGNPSAQTEEHAARLVPWLETLVDPKCSDDVATLWAYTVGVFDEGSPLHATLHRAFNPRNRSMDEDILMKPWISKGRREGMKRGLQKGRAEGRARALLDVLELRALPLPPRTRQHILSTRDERALERWFRRALAAASLDEIFLPNEVPPVRMGAAKGTAE